MPVRSSRARWPRHFERFSRARNSVFIFFLCSSFSKGPGREALSPDLLNFGETLGKSNKTMLMQYFNVRTLFCFRSICAVVNRFMHCQQHQCYEIVPSFFTVYDVICRLLRIELRVTRLTLAHEWIRYTTVLTGSLGHHSLKVSLREWIE